MNSRSFPPQHDYCYQLEYDSLSVCVGVRICKKMLESLKWQQQESRFSQPTSNQYTGKCSWNLSSHALSMPCEGGQ